MASTPTTPVAFTISIRKFFQLFAQRSRRGVLVVADAIGRRVHDFFFRMSRSATPRKNSSSGSAAR
jgi:hypothetical protein